MAAGDLRCTRLRLKTAWDRDDFALIAVASVCLMEDPKFNAPIRSSKELMLT
jgi:hypothetical protein